MINAPCEGREHRAWMRVSNAMMCLQNGLVVHLAHKHGIREQRAPLGSHCVACRSHNTIIIIIGATNVSCCYRQFVLCVVLPPALAGSWCVAKFQFARASPNKFQCARQANGELLRHQHQVSEVGAQYFVWQVRKRQLAARISSLFLPHHVVTKLSRSKSCATLCRNEIGGGQRGAAWNRYNHYAAATRGEVLRQRGAAGEEGGWTDDRRYEGHTRGWQTGRADQV